ncbi:MAG: aquaporin [Polyangiaceae bacterium]
MQGGRPDGPLQGVVGGSTGGGPNGRGGSRDEGGGAGGARIVPGSCGQWKVTALTGVHESTRGVLRRRAAEEELRRGSIVSGNPRRRAFSEGVTASFLRERARSGSASFLSKASMRRYVAEAVGTFGVIFAGCGAVAVGGARLGDTGVALAFGLALAAMTLVLAPISGAHMNPAITVAMALAGRIRARDVGPYVGAQLAGGVAGAGAVIAIAADRAGGASVAAEALANGHGRLSPGAYGLGAALVAEIALTALLVLVFLSVSDAHPREATLEAAQSQRAAHAVTAAAVGVAYTLIHLVGLPVTRLAANPARALGPALFAQGDAIAQLWLFAVGPAMGALLAAGIHRALWATPRSKPITLVAAGTLPYRANVRPPVAQPLDDEDDDDAGPSTLRSPRPPRVEPSAQVAVSAESASL